MFIFKRVKKKKPHFSKFIFVSVCVLSASKALGVEILQNLELPARTSIYLLQLKFILKSVIKMAACFPLHHQIGFITRCSDVGWI